MRVRNLVLGLLLAAPMTLSGCLPFSLGLATPVLMPPWVANRIEEKYCYKNDFRTPILPPIRPGFPPPLCEDPPDEARILRALPPVKRGMPYFFEEFRDNYQFVTERIVDKIDPPRFYPLIGPAQLHHCHWKCTVYFTQTIQSGYPCPFHCVRPAVDVVYIDLDHLHQYPSPTPEVQRDVTRDLLNQ